MDSEARKIHGQAGQARERGDFLEALKLDDEAMLSYQKDGDILGFSEVLADRFLVLRHLYEQTSDQNYLILAKHTAMASVEIAENSGDKKALAIPLFNLAKAQDTLGEFKDAVETYKKALENIINNPPDEHNVHERPAIIADFKVHLETCSYKAGDKFALERAEQALSELEAQPDISDYNQNVWVSGGHMRIAEMLREDNPQKAKEHLEAAKKIIDADVRLTLRKAQLEKLTQKFV